MPEESPGAEPTAASASPRLVDLARGTLTAQNAGDVDALMALYAPDAVWDVGGSGVAGERLEGSAAIRRFVEEWMGAFEDMRIEAEEIRAFGDSVVFAHLVQHGRPHGSVAAIDFRFATVSLWADGVIHQNAAYTDIDEARATAERLAGEREAHASSENVEIVREFYETVNRNLDLHWQQPRSYTEGVAGGSPDSRVRQTLDTLADDIRWVDIMGVVRSGKLAWAEGVDDLLRALEDYRIRVLNIEDLLDGLVLIEFRAELAGRASGVAGAEPLFAVFTIRDGLIAELTEHASRSDALEAAGAGE